ncbi:hypothetical protein SeMB42_g02158 [Synchytrium endobioticum]|uniref:Homoaconitase, mitochondrial n=1 Tax=Synchytrium endobioticum TaxID=286115 RepID=A0A507DH65_9FUNG|nr:hypothetical protein SeLEV6574_g05153 [Synchytrium endobioticum]TPX50741.1 hypothetical protein SeMB42_g02158 [Synchytrium endobioticum]
MMLRRAPPVRISCRLYATCPPPQTLIEKIVQKYTFGIQPGQYVKAGDFVSIQPEHVMTHDNTAAVIQKFTSMGASKLKHPKQPVFTLDHDIQNKSEKNLLKYRSIATFASTHSITFYPAGRGIGHQIMIEEGHAFPGTLTVASDSHSNMYGGIGCLGTPIVRTDAAAIWATGRTWWQIPPIARVHLTNRLPPGVTGKDVIITLCSHFGRNEVLNHALEFVGTGIPHLSIDDRLTIANMTTEWGALAAVFPIDHTLLAWLHGHHHDIPRIASLANAPTACPDAHYAKHISFDLSTTSPSVSGPDDVKTAHPVHTLEAQNIAIQKAYLVSCTNARASDLKQAATVFRGHRVHEGVQFYFGAASSKVQQQAEVDGDWKILVDAGGIPLPSGCGPCIGLGVGLLRDGEVCISSTNRNFKGRMGSPRAHAYLSSPAIVAASAIAGKIASPASLTRPLIAGPSGSIAVSPAPPDTRTHTCTPHTQVAGFAGCVSGEIVFLDADNLNTDAIYPGKYTYQDDMAAHRMAQVAMENYDAAFYSVVRKGDVVVAGSNFGCGSSREQAATCLKHAGVGLVLAESFSETYKRNAINNALLVLEAPELVRALREAFGRDEPVLSRRTGWIANVDLVNGLLKIEGKREFGIPAVGSAAQELVVEGGLEQWVKNRLA